MSMSIGRMLARRIVKRAPRGGDGKVSRCLTSSADAVRPDIVFAPSLPATAFVAPAADTMEAIGHEFGLRARRRDVLLLQGGLGVGKTAFARGFVRGA